MFYNEEAEQEARLAKNSSMDKNLIQAPAKMISDEFQGADILPVSGDHLGTFSHKGITDQGDPADEFRRERIYLTEINLWEMITA